jgi:predicted O-linked N-acetylglucosamine transferase (SPINDLY family)
MTVSRTPGAIVALLLRGREHQRARRWAEAERAYRQVLQIDPGHPEALASLGMIAFAAGRDEAAIAFCRRALERDPSNADLHYNLGEMCRKRRDFPRAWEAYNAAINLRPDLIDAYRGYADAAKTAAQSFTILGDAKGVRELHQLAAYYLRGMADRMAALGQAMEAEAARREALRLDELDETFLFVIQYRGHADEIFEAHRRWGLAAAAVPHGVRDEGFVNERDPAKRLRVGYVSPDFRRHSVSHFIEPLLAHHDPEQVEVFCYAEMREVDAVTEHLRGLAHHWRPTQDLSDEEVRRQIRADGIDVLIDLAGHTEGTRLPALASKPAPVTASWLGYPGTTGLPTIDYRITDLLADPEGSERLHTERLIRLPQGFLCYRPPAEAPEVLPPPALAREGVTFGSFNRLAKVTPEVVKVWARILHALPRARLLVKDALLRNEDFRRDFAESFAREGVGPERLDLRAFMPGLADHLGAYGEVDVALDPFPYNGTTTTCEALWMGVPVVNLVGDRHAGRVGLSLLSRVGLDHLTASDIDSYVRIATVLAGDLPGLARLRGELRDRLRQSSLCDAPRFARAFEVALRVMWQDWCSPPAMPC